jgi:membrane protease YdiL (CAAX protease family)
MPLLQSNTKRVTLIAGILILLGLVFSVPFATRLLLRNISSFQDIRSLAFWVSRILFWVALFMIFVYAREVEKQKLLLYPEKKYKFYVYILSVIGIFMVLFGGLFWIAQILSVFGLSKESLKFHEMIVMFRGNHLLIVFTCLTAGVVEELTMRGYVMSRLEIIFKSPIAAIFISSILFGLLHFGYGTIAQIVAPFFIGLVFAYYYWEFRNIKVVIFCHVAWDLMAIYLKV